MGVSMRLTRNTRVSVPIWAALIVGALWLGGVALWVIVLLHVALFYRLPRYVIRRYRSRK